MGKRAEKLLILRRSPTASLEGRTTPLQLLIDCSGRIMAAVSAMAFYLYVLRCADGSYYTGTYRGEDVATRVSEHNSGHYPDAYTSLRRPCILVYAQVFATITDAVAAERQVKGWSRSKKLAMIEGRWSDLPWLSSRLSVRARRE